MKSITFRRSAQNGRFYTYQFNGVYQDIPTYLDELIKSNSLIFKCLHAFKYFKCTCGDTTIIGHTDKYGNKILQIR